MKYKFKLDRDVYCLQFQSTFLKSTGEYSKRKNNLVETPSYSTKEKEGRKGERKHFSYSHTMTFALENPRV